MIERASGYWVIIGTLLVAAVLAILPMDHAIAWWRPEWILLVLIYWAIAVPQRIGFLTALMVGLLVDVLEGAALGHNMLSLGLVVTMARLMYQRLRVFSTVQQALVVFVLTGIHQLISQWLHSITGSAADSFVFLLPALTSALLWPPVMLTLRSLRRSYRVS